MPSESAITQMMEIFTEVIDLGGVEERTAIVPNLSVTDAAPTGLTNFIVVQDDRDGDNILAKTVPGVVYANNDKVNVMFIRGTEPIAFQQGSGSSSSGIWGIVPSTSTDIFYDKGDVGIGKSVAPDASLEVLNTAQAQLRLTHTEDTKFADFTLDTNHDLTIKPTSTGQIIFQPTTDSIDFFQVLDADGGNPVLNVDSTNERVGIGTAAPSSVFHISQSALAIQFNFENTGDTTAIRRTTLSFTHSNGTGARIQARRESGDSDGMRLTFATEPVGGALTDVMIITKDARVGILPSLVPTAKLHVDQSESGDAIPVLLLDQADISEEFISFVGTAAAATLTQSIVAEADVTTATRQGFVKIEIEDIGNQVTDQAYFVPFFTLA